MEKKLEVCRGCKKEFFDSETLTCKETLEFPDGKELNRIPFALVYKGEVRIGCEGCGIAPGGYHHIGCREEICPKCGKEIISCGCVLDNYELFTRDGQYNIWTLNALMVRLTANDLKKLINMACEEEEHPEVFDFIEEILRRPD